MNTSEKTMMTYSTYEAKAIERFAKTYNGAVVGVEEDEGWELARSVYARLKNQFKNECRAVNALYAEMIRYEDM